LTGAANTLKTHNAHWTHDTQRRSDIADVVQHVDQDLYGAFVIDREPGAGLRAATVEQLPDAGTTTGLRNFLYGLEWWVFGGFIIYIWWRHMLDVTKPAPEKDAQEGAVPSGT